MPHSAAVVSRQVRNRATSLSLSGHGCGTKDATSIKWVQGACNAADFSVARSPQRSFSPLPDPRGDDR